MQSLFATSGSSCLQGALLGLGLLRKAGFAVCMQGGRAEPVLDKGGLKYLPAIMSYILSVKKHNSVLELPALTLCILSRSFLI